MTLILAYTYSMGESGAEEFKPKGRVIRRTASQDVSNPDRRKVLKILAGLAAGGATTYVAKRLNVIPNLGGDLDQPKNRSVTTGQLEADVQLASVERNELTYQDRLDAAEEKARKDIETPGVKERLRTYGPMIIEVGNGAGNDTKIPQGLFLGQAMAESVCDPDAVSDDGAIGLFGIMPEIAEFYEKDPRDSKQNAEMAADLLRQDYEKFGDWSLTFLAFHNGRGRVYKAVKTYSENYEVEDPKKRVVLEDINVPIEGDSPEARERATSIATDRITQYQTFIKNYGINVKKLYEIEKVRNLFVGGEWDRTWDYWARIVKSAEILRSQNLVQVTKQQ